MSDEYTAITDDDLLNFEPTALAYLKAAWPKLAALAYAGYLDYGRGALLIRLQSLKRGVDGSATADVSYCAGPALMEELTDDDRLIVALYNPQLQAVCVVITPAGRRQGWLYDPAADSQPAPLACYQRRLKRQARRAAKNFMQN